MLRFPELKRPDYGVFVRTLSKLWKQPHRHSQTRFYRLDCEILRSPLPFLDIKRVELTRPALQEKQNADLGSAAWLNLLFCYDAVCPQRGKQAVAGNTHRTYFYELSACQSRDIRDHSLHFSSRQPTITCFSFSS